MRRDRQSGEPSVDGSDVSTRFCTTDPGASEALTKHVCSTVVTTLMDYHAKSER